MRYIWIWSDGELEFRPYIGDIHHINLLQDMLEEGRLPYNPPRDSVSGYYEDVGDPDYNTIRVEWLPNGNCPTQEQIKYMIESQLGRFNSSEQEAQQTVLAMADRSGVSEIDDLIEEFLHTPMGDWTTDTSPIEALKDPARAHGNCQVVTEQFVDFAKSKGLNAYVTNTDLDELGYTPDGKPQGEVLAPDGAITHGFYDEHTVASIYLPQHNFPIIVDFTATQYGYTDHPKVFSKVAATVEDSEPPQNFGFLKEPHEELYPCAWKNNKMIPKAKKAMKDHVLSYLAEQEYADADKWIYFTVYGSGASYNWDEDGDFDLQLWVDYNKYKNAHPDSDMTADELVADIRRNVQIVNFPSFADLGLANKDCVGSMIIQYYAKPGEGSEEENLAQKPYACYDMETDKWLVEPKPYGPQFYGEEFILVEPKAKDIAVQAEALIGDLERNIAEWSFWSQLGNQLNHPYYLDIANQAKENATLDKEGIHNLFLNVFKGRMDAYSEMGKGIEDERDAVEKMLEVWGTFQNLRHYTKADLPWETQELPEEKEAHIWDRLQGEDPGASLQQWIQERGPLFFHITGSGRDDEPIVMSIMRQGLLTDKDMITKGIKNPKGPQHESEQHLTWLGDETFYKIVSDYHEDLYHTPPQIMVDVRNLDPSKIEIFKTFELGKDWNAFLKNYPDGHEFAVIAYEGSLPSENVMLNPRIKDRFIHASKDPHIQKFADWTDIMEKAKRLINDNQVNLTNNEPNHINGVVQGDHGTYNTEIWRDDPNSRAITQWDCDCPWSTYSWGRTRQWKKFEGRPCAHTLALFWQALRNPVTPDQDGMTPVPPAVGPQPGLQAPMSPVETQPQIPGPMSPAGPPPPQGPPNMIEQGEQAEQAMTQPEQTPPQPAFSQPTPYDQLSPSNVGFPGALSHTGKIVHRDPEDDSGYWLPNHYSMGLRGDLPEGLEIVHRFEDTTPSKLHLGAFINNVSVGILDLEQKLNKPNYFITFINVVDAYRRRGIAEALFNKAEEITGYPVHHDWEIMSDEGEGWAREMDKRHASYPNGTRVRLRHPMYGLDRTGIRHMIPASSAGEVIHSDEKDTYIIVPLKSGINEPHLVRVFGSPDDFYPEDKSTPFIKRR
jgi:hypothetical protein